MDERDIARNVHIKRKAINIQIEVGGKKYKGHSQIGQDKWVLERVFNGKRDGYFVEVGAADGELFSNAYLLEKEFGWTGICVEPDSRYFPVLVKNRDVICENVCLLDKRTTVDFLEIGVLGGIPECYNAPKKRPKGQILKKQTLTLQDVLEKNNAPETIDFLSIDTEGSEYRILKDFPFHKYKFLAVCVEHNNVVRARNQLRKLFTSKGYVLDRHVKYDDWWVHSSIANDLH